MKTKEGRGFNLGAAILAAVTVGVGAAAMMSRRDHSGPDIYMDVYSKPGVVSPGAVASALYEDKLQRDMENGMSHGISTPSPLDSVFHQRVVHLDTDDRLFLSCLFR